MSQLTIGILLSKLDDWRVGQHFKHVEVNLRARDVSHLPHQLRQVREDHLNQLHAYAARGVFPRNHEQLVFAPCFIDRDNRECAVANLMMFSGHTETVHQIAAVANYAYVPQMNFPELEDWSRQSGFSKEELALIQPGYYATLDGVYLVIVLTAWITGLIAVLMNLVQMIRRRSEGITVGIGLVLAIPSLLVGIDCLYNASYAYDLGTRHDGYPFDLPLRDVGPLALAALIGLGIALLTAGLSIYRIRTFVKSIPNEQSS